MRITGSVIKEQGVTFGVFIVKPQFTQPGRDAEGALASLRPHFPGIHLVLASQDSAGRFHFLGRKDLVQFLAALDLSRIPWKEYSW